MLNSKSIGNKIAEARKNINFSQSELAKQVSISPQAVGKWERGESMPDIATLARLAEIFGVDLNYFTENSLHKEAEQISQHISVTKTKEDVEQRKEKSVGNWDMSRGNWLDSDFSGLKNLKEQFSSSNIKSCIFVNSELSDLKLESNNIEACDFSDSTLRNSIIQSSNLLNNRYNNCSLIDTVIKKSNISKCNFTGANFSGAEINEVNFEKNEVCGAVWKHTTFKNTSFSEINFEGALEDCHFENCSFYKASFENAIITNTFFKYNRRFKKVLFINCKVDKITYAFLKNNHANLSNIQITE